MPVLDSLWKANFGALEPYWPHIWNELGTTGTVLPLVGPGDDGAPNATSFTTRRANASGLEAVFTWSEAPSAFDAALDLTNPANWQGIVPVATFNGTDEEADTPDAAGWSVVTTAFSIGLWIRPTDVTTIGLLTKYDRSSGSIDTEWQVEIGGSSIIRFQLFDTSAASTAWTIYRDTSTSIVTDQWQFVVCTCNATQTAFTDLNLYINGALDNGSGATEANFVAMEAGATKPALGFRTGTSGPTSLK